MTSGCGEPGGREFSDNVAIAQDCTRAARKALLAVSPINLTYAEGTDFSLIYKRDSPAELQYLPARDDELSDTGSEANSPLTGANTFAGKAAIVMFCQQ